MILGPPARNQWLNFGVPHQSLVMSFPVDLPAQVISGAGELVVRSLVSDGCFLYVFSSKGLLKIGSGYGSSIRQHVYMHKPDFFAGDRHGWLGHCQVRFRFHNILVMLFDRILCMLILYICVRHVMILHLTFQGKLYSRIGRKKTEVFEIDKTTFEVKHVIKLNPGSPPPVDPKSAVFSDGQQLGLIMLASFVSTISNQRGTFTTKAAT